MIIGVDHGLFCHENSAICFPSGIVRYEHEPYTNRGVLRIEGKYYVWRHRETAAFAYQDRE